MKVQWTHQGRFSVGLESNEIDQLDTIGDFLAMTPAETVERVLQCGIIELLCRVDEAKTQESKQQVEKVTCPICNKDSVTKIDDVCAGGVVLSTEYHCKDCGNIWPKEVIQQVTCPVCSHTGTVQIDGKEAEDIGRSAGLYCRHCHDSGEHVWLAKIPDNLDGDTDNTGKESKEDVEQGDDTTSDIEDEQHKEHETVTSGDAQVTESPDE